MPPPEMLCEVIGLPSDDSSHFKPQGKFRRAAQYRGEELKQQADTIDLSILGSTLLGPGSRKNHDAGIMD
ncbi:hypothetical protein N7462_009385 [Penicillium macrosclerotiorum]|uniref:uncharacterized protein n=1 Tax=Penicillium macrosclerotiorum TaxID=303699 RepID=UPI0025486461|nr:uncharacterized protein N7462_009385 [Penicillium macrosclerotiorum]KAJ5673946.1 hypothetical protein N7462_009385 [Penicillium macrosclerotiorum]